MNATAEMWSFDHDEMGRRQVEMKRKAEKDSAARESRWWTALVFITGPVTGIVLGLLMRWVTHA